MLLYCLFLLCSPAFATVSLSDPSDVIDPDLWAADNAIEPDFDVPFISTQPSPIIAAYYFDDTTVSVSHESFSTTLNQTSVISIANNAEVNISYVDVEKSGYASNLLESSFWGFNAAINIVSHG